MSRSLPPSDGAVPGPLGASPMVFPHTEEGTGQVTILTRPVRLDDCGPHSLEPCDSTTMMVLGTHTATLDTVRVRAPGEHKAGDQRADAELQLRFLDAEGSRVVLALPMIRGPASMGIDAFMTGSLDIRLLLEGPRKLAGYHGYDSIPPFEVPTMWLVSLTPLTILDSQLAELMNRSPRPLPPCSPQLADSRPVVRLHAKVLSLHLGDSGADTGEMVHT